jgi:hypothetical protein
MQILPPTARARTRKDRGSTALPRDAAPLEEPDLYDLDGAERTRTSYARTHGNTLGDYDGWVPHFRGTLPEPYLERPQAPLTPPQESIRCPHCGYWTQTPCATCTRR